MDEILEFEVEPEIEIASFGWVVYNDDGEIVLHSADKFSSDAVPAEEEVVSVDGRLYYKSQAPEPNLAELKAAKRAEINAARDLAEQGGFEYLGKTFDSDPVSCQRISCAAQAMAYAPAVVTTEAESVSEQTITWTCQDNTTIDLSASQLQGLVAALAQHSNTCHQKATALKKLVDAAETEEEVSAIAW